MPTKRVGDVPVGGLCLNPDHTPPMFRKYDPGVYEHECAGCGKKTRFIIRGTRYTVDSESSWVPKFNEHMDKAMKQLDDAMKTMEKAFEGW